MFFASGPQDAKDKETDRMSRHRQSHLKVKDIYFVSLIHHVEKHDKVCLNSLPHIRT